MKLLVQVVCYILLFFCCVIVCLVYEDEVRDHDTIWMLINILINMVISL